MQSKISWFNKEIVLQGFRSAGWLGIMYLGALLFLLPLKMVMVSTSEYPQQYLYNTKNISSFTEIPDLFMLVVPVLVAIFILRYLQVKQSSDLFHSLPIKRNVLYKHLVTVGILLVTVPVILTGLLMTILHPILEFETYFSMDSIFIWTGVTVLYNLLIYTACIVTGMLTGNSIVQGVLTYIFLFLPVGLSLLITYNLDMFLYGYKGDYLMRDGIEKLSPLTRVAFLRNIPFTLIETFIYAGLVVILIIAGLIIYNKRKLEMVSNPIAFQFLKPVFKYGVTFSTMILGGFYFAEVEGQGQIGWTLFGYIAGAILGYLIAEMILQKTWRITFKVKGFIYYTIVTSVLFLFIQFDITGYENRIPDINDIERIYYSNMDYYYFNDEEAPTQYFYEEENMKNILKWHEELLKEKSTKIDKNKYSDKAFFAYELKNGKTIIREYEIPFNARNIAFLKPIYESLEYKNVNYRAMQVEVGDVNSITFRSRGPVSEEVVITQDNEIKELVDLLKEDIKTETYEEQVNNLGIISEMVFQFKDDARKDYIVESGHSIKASYSAIVKWLKKEGKYEDAVLSGNDIEYAFIVKQDKDLLRQDDMYSVSFEEIEKRIQNNEDAVKITDKEQITLLLNKSNADIYDNRFEGNYIVAFKFKKGEYVDLRRLDIKYYKSILEN